MNQTPVLNSDYRARLLQIQEIILELTGQKISTAKLKEELRKLSGSRLMKGMRTHIKALIAGSLGIGLSNQVLQQTGLSEDFGNDWSAIIQAASALLLLVVAVLRDLPRVEAESRQAIDAWLNEHFSYGSDTGAVASGEGRLPRLIFQSLE